MQLIEVERVAGIIIDEYHILEKLGDKSATNKINVLIKVCNRAKLIPKVKDTKLLKRGV